jgi:DNA-binding NtrC family response regulator
MGSICAVDSRGAVVLLVDDDSVTRRSIGRYLTLKGFGVVEAEDCASAKARFTESNPHICVLDHMLPDGTALDLLGWFTEQSPDFQVPAIVLTGYGSIDLAVKAIKMGASQFLTKPVDLETLTLLVSRTMEGSRDRRILSAEKRKTTASPLDPFLGTSDRIRALRESALRVSRSESPVLVEGETGTGKTVLARWIHDHGPRGGEPFIDLNCGGLSREFLESELFGHEKGAFTGAVTAKQGLLETANRGTIFLDEIGDMDAQVQPKVLKVIEEKRFRRIGAVRDITVDVRLIAATHRNLEEAARNEKFRADLYYRVSALPLRMPALRDRVEDIPLLAGYFLNKLARDLVVAVPEIAPCATNALCRYSWPGNLRELRNVLERALLHSDGATVVASMLDLRFEPVETPAEPVAESLEENESRYLKRVLEQESWDVEAAAARLGLSRSTLYYKIKKFGIALPRS